MNNNVVVPVGDMVIVEGDKLVMIEVEHSLDFPRVEEDEEN